ncbi:hypothetical protein AAFF_G00232800 [Aldrovandia affinis]|uniref:Uncharacterized protein n=1 Tax=Aldrovandia affinis TaxID=143900 RepID=A0AAD7RFH7_9TELE|nr:hypothetical protein AAFF_G00232800 [Aldrovandia affinis]
MRTMDDDGNKREVEAKSQSLSSVLLLLDLSAAFDTMDHQILLSSLVPARISACLTDISAWMSTHHLKLNLGKTELLFLPAKGSPMIDASRLTVEGSIVSPSQSARSLGVTLDNQLCFSSHIAAITRTCRFSLHNIRRIRPFLTQEATQLTASPLLYPDLLMIIYVNKEEQRSQHRSLRDTTAHSTEVRFGPTYCYSLQEDTVVCHNKRNGAQTGRTQAHVTGNTPKEKSCYSLPTVKKLLEQKRKRETSSSPSSSSSAEASAGAGATAIPVSTPAQAALTGGASSYSDPMGAMGPMPTSGYSRWNMVSSHQTSVLQQDCPFPPIGGTYFPLSSPGDYSQSQGYSSAVTSSFITQPTQDFSDAMSIHAYSSGAMTSSLPGTVHSAALQSPSYSWGTTSGVQAPMDPGPPGFGGQINVEMLDEARMFLRGMDNSKKIWQDEDGDTILHIYTAKGLREYAFAAAENLKALGRLDSKEHKGKTALLVAVTANQPDIVQDLLSLGADINACDVKGQTSLHLAATYGFPRVMQGLGRPDETMEVDSASIRGHIREDCPKFKGKQQSRDRAEAEQDRPPTPIIPGAQILSPTNGQTERTNQTMENTLRCLVSANPTSLNLGFSLLCFLSWRVTRGAFRSGLCATLSGHLAEGSGGTVARAADRQREFANRRRRAAPSYRTRIETPVSTRPALVVSPIGGGIWLSASGGRGRESRHESAEEKVNGTILSFELVDLEARNFEGQTPLHCAAISHSGTVKALSSVLPGLGDTGLQAQAEDKLSCVQLLLTYGASLLSQDIKSNKTVLHLAVKEGNIHLVRYLLRVNLPDMQAFANMKAHGNTALHMAAGLHGSCFQEEMIRLLLSRGADPSVRNLENDQPAHLLQSGERGEQLKLILKKRTASSRRRIMSLQDQDPDRLREVVPPTRTRTEKRRDRGERLPGARRDGAVSLPAEAERRGLDGEGGVTEAESVIYRLRMMISNSEALSSAQKRGRVGSKELQLYVADVDGGWWPPDGGELPLLLAPYQQKRMVPRDTFMMHVPDYAENTVLSLLELLYFPDFGSRESSAAWLRQQLCMVWGGHLHPVVKNFYPDGSGLFQDDNAPIHRPQVVTKRAAVREIPWEVLVRIQEG